MKPKLHGWDTVCTSKVCVNIESRNTPKWTLWEFLPGFRHIQYVINLLHHALPYRYATPKQPVIEAQCGNLLPSLCLWCGHLCDLYFETTPKFSTRVRQGGPSCHFMWDVHLLAWGPMLLPSCNIALSGPAKPIEVRFLGGKYYLKMITWD